MAKRWFAILLVLLLDFQLAPAQYPPGPAPGDPVPGPFPCGTEWVHPPLPPCLAPPGPPDCLALPADLPNAFDIHPPLPCGPRLWLGADYLLWWVDDAPLVPLVTTGAPTDPAPAVLGQPGTVVLYGNERADFSSFSGIRATAGGWFNNTQTFGMEASAFLLDRRTTGFQAVSDATGSPILAIPIIDAAPPGPPSEFAFFLSFPGVFTGAIDVQSRLRLWGAEANLFANYIRADGFRLDLFVGGFRYLDLAEDLTLVANSQALGGQARWTDQFETRNQFYGGTLGSSAGVRLGAFSLDVTGKLSLGVVHQVVQINGFADFPALGQFPGGILALPSNIGRNRSDVLGVVPEAQVMLGWTVFSFLRAYVGYNFLYLSNAVQPGDQIDRNINLTQVQGALGPPPVTPTGAPLPQPRFVDSDFFAHGLTAGLLFGW
jgi:hypothetical protein